MIYNPGFVIPRTLLLALLLAGCTTPEIDRVQTPVSAPPPTAPPDALLSVDDWEDLDRFAGQRVTIQGTFDQIQGKHGMLKLPSGLIVYLPHFDMFRRGDDWLKYVGKKVRATGVLQTYAKDIPGYSGPSIAVDGFELAPETP